MTDQTIESVPDISDQLLVVISSLREVADQIGICNPNVDQSNLATISRKLKQIGWNTLFASSLIDTLLRSGVQPGDPECLRDQADFSHQLASLQVAVGYLTQTIHFLASDILATNQDHPEIQKAFLRLGDQLLEVASGCKRL